jgi:excisionase family DNA binding protein
MKTTESTISPAAFRLPDAAHYVGISPALMKKLVREQKVRSIKLGRTRVFPRAALDELLAQRAA